MRFILITLACLLSCNAIAATGSSANKKNIYKCVDASGKKNYQSSPCKDGIDNTVLDVDTGKATNLDKEKELRTLKDKEEQAKIEAEKQAKKEQKEKQEAVNKQAIAESAKNQELIKSDPKKFSPDAIHAYEPNKLPDLIKNYQERLNDIERLRRSAAEKALATGECGRVESVELDPKSTKVVLAFLVDCSSGKPFYYTELDFLRKE